MRRAVLAHTSDGPVPVGHLLCAGHSGQHLPGGHGLQKCQVHLETQVSYLSHNCIFDLFFLSVSECQVHLETQVSHLSHNCIFDLFSLSVSAVSYRNVKFILKDKSVTSLTLTTVFNNNSKLIITLTDAVLEVLQSPHCAAYCLQHAC